MTNKSLWGVMVIYSRISFLPASRECIKGKRRGRGIETLVPENIHKLEFQSVNYFLPGTHSHRSSQKDYPIIIRLFFFVLFSVAEKEFVVINRRNMSSQSIENEGKAGKNRENPPRNIIQKPEMNSHCHHFDSHFTSNHI